GERDQRVQKEERKEQKEKKKGMELEVLLLEADLDWGNTEPKHVRERDPDKPRPGDGVDRTALRNFPPNLEELNKYDVLIIGDCDPRHKKLQTRLKDIAAFVKGENEQGGKGTKAGGGILFMAGAFHNPHNYRGTPL